MNLTSYVHNGLELFIDQSSGQVFASQGIIAKICNQESSTIRYFLDKRGVESLAESFPIKDSRGVEQKVKLYCESAIKQSLAKYNPELLLKCVDAGLRVFLYGLAGYEVKPVEKEQPKLPVSYKDALKALIKEIEEKEALEAEKDLLEEEKEALEAEKDLLEEEKEALEAEKELLEEENEQLSEAVDELFNYSSIIRIAKFNDCTEKNFNWRKLVAISRKMKLEVKKVPCPRYGTKNLYSHDVWRYCYPNFQLPETTTLVIKK